MTFSIDGFVKYLGEYASQAGATARVLEIDHVNQLIKITWTGTNYIEWRTWSLFKPTRTVE